MKGVAVHWTVTPARSDHAQCDADWAGVIAQHAGQGYKPSPAYNWGACQHGIRFEGRGWGIRSAANGTAEANRDYWAIVALIAPGDAPSPELLDALAALIDEAPDLESRTVRPHSDFYATACCGDELRAWIASGAESPAAPPAPIPTEDDMGRLVHDSTGAWWILTKAGTRYRVWTPEQATWLRDAGYCDTNTPAWGDDATIKLFKVMEGPETI